jgi:hypothetical protein
MASVTIQDRTSTGDPSGSITLPDLPDWITLRELIRIRVREEVARENLRTQRTPTGTDQALDWRPQADRAIEDFLAGGYIVLINGGQVEDLETRLDLRGGLDVRFVRLTPIGGA